jgi:hypothetical protein
MPQGPFQTQTLGNAVQRSLQITAETLVKPANGFVATISVNAVGSTTGAIYDAASIASASASNLIAVIPEAVGVYAINFPFKSGLVVAPGTGHTLSVAYT